MNFIMSLHINYYFCYIMNAYLLQNLFEIIYKRHSHNNKNNISNIIPQSDLERIKCTDILLYLKGINTAFKNIILQLVNNLVIIAPKISCNTPSFRLWIFSVFMLIAKAMTQMEIHEKSSRGLQYLS